MERIGKDRPLTMLVGCVSFGSWTDDLSLYYGDGNLSYVLRTWRCRSTGIKSSENDFSTDARTGDRITYENTNANLSLAGTTMSGRMNRTFQFVIGSTPPTLFAILKFENE